MGRLQNKVAIITGSTSGMGADTARAFVREGAKVVVTGRNTARGEAIAGELGGEHAVFVAADVTVESDVVRLIETTVATFGAVDSLFNNAAGPTQDVPATDVDADKLQTEMMNVLGSVFLMIKHVVPIMKANNGGSIINNGSTAAHRANSSPAVYSALKSGVCHLSRCYAMELSELGIRVNTISPGAIATPIFAKQFGVPADKEKQVTDILAQTLGNFLPAGRSGQGADVANAAVFLASDESSFITGQDLVVDGGLTGGLAPAQKKAQAQILRGAVETALGK